MVAAKKRATRKTTKTPRKRGRPTVYTRELAEAICKRIALGESLLAICRSEGMPPESTVRLWALDDVDGFAASYARARELGYEHHGELILDLADQCREGVKRTLKGDGSIEEVTADMVERARLQIDARKWVLARMLPKRYGDKVTQEVTGADGAPLIPAEDPATLAKKVAFILMRGATNPKEAA